MKEYPIEIIIPSYNAHKTIKTTLDSILKQNTIFEYHVTIVNDDGKNYNDIVNNYQDINISEIKTPTNVGPGSSRQYGIDNTKSKYIVFIDSDDYFYDEYSLENLITEIEKSNADIVISNFIYERDNKHIIKKHNQVWLHGKIYRRSYLEKHNIKFNNTRANEDNGFNSLCFLLNPIVVYLNKITYVYKENSLSITRKDNRLYKYTGLEWYAYNIVWAIEEAEQRNANPTNIAIKAISGLSVMYLYYLELYNTYEVENILKWSKNIYLKYLKYKNIADNYEKQALNNEEFNYQDLLINNKITFNEFKQKINRLL